MGEKIKFFATFIADKRNNLVTFVANFDKNSIKV